MRYPRQDVERRFAHCFEYDQHFESFETDVDTHSQKLERMREIDELLTQMVKENPAMQKMLLEALFAQRMGRTQ